MEGSGSMQIFTDQNPGGPKTYGFYVTGSGTLISIMFSHKKNVKTLFTRSKDTPSYHAL